jgi:hypothetical protein
LQLSDPLRQIRGSLLPPPPSAKVQPRGKQRRDVRTLHVTVEVRW